MHVADPRRPEARNASAGLILVLAMLCAGPTAAEPMNRQLAPCPDRPNCVSSLATDEEHRVEPFAPSGEQTWPALRAAVAALPRTRVVEDEPGYLHAECTSRIFRFVDDLELSQSEHSGHVDVRSASRVGYGDWGVNRARVEALRAALAEAGAVKSAAR